VHLPKLTFISQDIRICQNNADFVIPSGQPNAPVGGLTSFAYKGDGFCWFQQGAATCDLDICP
jgi:hypothetical protein